MADSLDAQASKFASELGATLKNSLPQSPGVDAQRSGNRIIVQPTDSKGTRKSVPLFVDKQELARLDLHMYLALDHTGAFLKTVRTDLSVYSVLDDQPLFRLDYRADMHKAPKSHWQFHAERGSLTHLLTLANQHRPKKVKNPHTLSRLHFPVGGERFRPCVEDVIQFLIEECGVDCERGWSKAVNDGRERWRRLQLRSIVRDLQEDAAEALRSQGWVVTPPAKPTKSPTGPLRDW